MLQAEKTERTHREILKAAQYLFLDQGFDRIGITDIMRRAGYSTGTFYRHYKTKSEVLIELWSEFVEQYICESISGAMQAPSLEEAIKYLVERNKEYYTHPMFSCYYNASVTRVLNSGKEDIPVSAKDFTDMLYDLLKREFPDAEINRLKTYASAIHAIINAYASDGVMDQNFYFDEATATEILMNLALCAGRQME